MNLSSRTIAFAKKTIEFLSKTLDAWISIQSQYLSHARVCFRGGFVGTFRGVFRHHSFFLFGFFVFSPQNHFADPCLKKLWR